MKKKLLKLGVLIFGTVLMLGSTMVANATDERSYTYNYDYWGDVQDSPDSYEVVSVVTAVELGLDKKLMAPEGLSVYGNMIYICDTGNNRILEIERTSTEKVQLKRVIDSFEGLENNTFSQPTDFAISEDGNYFICDKGNARILKLDKDLNYIMEFNKPDSSALEEGTTFAPSKLVVDSAERVYCVAIGINKGMIKYENDGTFSEFVGASKVSYDFIDYLYKKFATQEQRERLESFVPTEYTNLFMDQDGFIYAVSASLDEDDLKAEKVDAVRKLNLMGSDILVRNGEQPIYGDLYFGNGGGYVGPSQFADVTCFDNDIYVCMDRNRGRLFGYDDQGRIVFCFGSNGNMDGYFRQPAALEHMGHDLLVLDSLDCSLTIFGTTEFGELVYQAVEQFDRGDYDASGASWQRVMDINGNYDLAYIGIGRSLLRQKKYHEAMKYFELKYDDDNYSKAFQQYRKEWVEEHIVIIIIVLVIVLAVPLIIGRIGDIKYEIDKSDFFLR